MLFTIRKSVFETNSSNTHSLTICTKKEFEEFGKGLWVMDIWNDKLVPAEEKSNDEDDEDHDEDYDEEEENDGQFKNIDQYNSYIENSGFETYEETFTTPSGDEMVAFGYFGRD